MHDDTLGRPAFKKLVEAGDVEVLSDEDSRPVASNGGSGRVHGSTHGHPANRTLGHKGDR